jgi:hypothetical protein
MLNAARLVGFSVAIAAATSPALAAPVVLDFDDIASGEYFANLTSNGFRLSPSCHIDVFPVSSGSNAIGWDRSGCLIGGGNPDYLGSTPAPGFSTIYIDRFDEPFAFTSMNLAPSSGFSLTSSNGGSLPLPPTAGAISVSGPDWTNIQWLEFTYSDIGIPSVRLDSLAFDVHSVPEPSTFWLLSICGIGLAVASRRRPIRG